MNPVAHAVGGDHGPAGGGGPGDRHRLEDRLHGEAERAAAPGEGVADDGEQRRAGHARPGQDEEQPREPEGPGGGQPVESVADHRERDEEPERATPTVSIADPPARVLVDAIEEVLARPEEPDGGDRRPKDLEVLGQKALPEVLAEGEQEHRHRDRDDVAFEPERGADARPGGIHARHPDATSRTPTPAGAGGRRRGRRCVRGRCPWLPSGLVGNVTLDRECSNRYIATMRWLMLLATLPPTPTRHRVGVWRKLQRMGAVRLRGSAWILPETAETTELFQWLVQEIETIRGEATLVHVERIENMADEQVRALFHKARTVEYQAVVHGCREILAQLDRHRANVAGHAAKLRSTLTDSSVSSTACRASTTWKRRPATGPASSGRRRRHGCGRRRRGRARRGDDTARRCRRREARGSPVRARTSTASPPRGSSSASATPTRSSASPMPRTPRARACRSTSSGPISDTTARIAPSRRSSSASASRTGACGSSRRSCTRPTCTTAR